MGISVHDEKEQAMVAPKEYLATEQIRSLHWSLLSDEKMYTFNWIWQLRIERERESQVVIESDWQEYV